ncbi:putative proton-dependent oligopeptide transporter family, major facilitator superfamily [Rosa chinensis]|uniref:Putative proton-dependent oligopeptide transporter family, major facilitator superfamily n=1 Tax=Rosa chinensis TaxID=74649 RepID=A0A2P6PER8_ROSCH|nr:putative proton-dependent oligopeptide transporter family, major facilitator superfamily [Rosa chinensis]
MAIQFEEQLDRAQGGKRKVTSSHDITWCPIGTYHTFPERELCQEQDLLLCHKLWAFSGFHQRTLWHYNATKNWNYRMFFSIISMVIAALVEMKRLQTARDYDLVDLPSATIPMCIWWLVPQYFLCGLADVFTMVGLQEFFYDHVPNELRSMGLALYLSIFGVGCFLINNFLISIIEEATS